ncbi:MAG: hypothetical protein HOO95_05785 [Gallionella sp.]|nr:hypothetical protein [Gallionella sp.]
MKRILSPMFLLLAATALSPQALALPAFARQTGMECSACHQQHFPVLNNFGRAFKAGGYTMIGTQGQVEGEHLSIPATLNTAVMIKMRYQRQSNGGVGSGDGTGTKTGDGQLQMGNEFSLFLGGRVADNIGFLMEGNVANPGALVAGLRLPIMFDKGDTKFSIIPFTTDALGVAYSYELSSAGIMRANRWAELRRDASAIQYAMADGNGSHGKWTGAAAGLAMVAQNEKGFINFTRWTPNALPGGNDGGNRSFKTNSNYLRIAATPTVSDWAIVGGVSMISGTSELDGASIAKIDPITGDPFITPPTVLPVDSALFRTEATSADIQAHGQVAGKDIGVYITYASSPATSAGERFNLFNTGAKDKSAFALGVDYSVIPRTLNVGAAYRIGETGMPSTANPSQSRTDDAFMLQAIYNLKQNMSLHATGATRNGTKYSEDTSAVGKNEIILMLEGAW